MKGITWRRARLGRSLLRTIGTMALVIALGSLIWLPAARAETVSDGQGDVLSCAANARPTTRT